MKKSLLWVIVVLLSVSMIAVFSLAGCKEAEKVAAPAEEEVTEEEAPAEEEASEEVPAGSEMEKAVIDGKKYAGTNLKTLVTGDAALDTYEPIVQEFSELTGINVEVSVIGWDVNITQVPLILSMDEYQYDTVDLWEGWVDEYGSAGKFVDIKDYMAPEIEQLIPRARELMTVGDTVPTFAFMPSWEVVFYNKDLVSEAGLDPESPPRTMDQFTEWFEKLSLDTNNDGKVDRYAMILDFTTDWGYIVFQHFHKAFGGQPFEIVDNKIKLTLDTPEMAEAVNYVKGLIQNGYMDPAVLTNFQWDVTSMYTNEEIPMMLMWDMYTAYLSPEILEKTAYFAFPGKVEGTFAGTSGIEFQAIPLSSPNKEAAMALLKYVCSHENTRMRTLVNGTVPPYAADWEDPEVLAAMPQLPEVKNAMAFETPRVLPVKAVNDLLTYIMGRVHKVALDEMTTEEFLKDIQEKADTFETMDNLVTRYEDYVK